MSKTTVAKQVHIIARFQFKTDPRKVAYHVRSSNGKDVYTTTLFDGLAVGCSCPAKANCYHKTQLQSIEADCIAKRAERANELRAQAAFKAARLAREAEEKRVEQEAAAYARIATTEKKLAACGFMR